MDLSDDALRQLRERSAGLGEPAGDDAPSTRRRPVRLLVGLGVLLLGLIALVVRAYVLHDNLAVWNYAWLTAPVAAAGAYLGYRVALGRGLGVGQISGLVVGTLGTSYLTGLTGGQGIGGSIFGGGDIACLVQNTCDPTSLPLPAQTGPGTVLDSASRIVQNYWQIYGPAGIISAAVAGLLAGVGFALVVNRNTRRDVIGR